MISMQYAYIMYLKKYMLIPISSNWLKVKYAIDFVREPLFRRNHQRGDRGRKKSTAKRRSFFEMFFRIFTGSMYWYIIYQGPNPLKKRRQFLRHFNTFGKNSFSTRAQPNCEVLSATRRDVAARLRCPNPSDGRKNQSWRRCHFHSFPGCLVVY